MVGLTELPGASSPGPGYTVSHQKLELEIDFATRSMKGKTKITILPTHKDLKTIRLHCRQCVLKRININGRGPTIKYQDPYSKLSMHSQAGVHQHQMLRQKIAPQVKEPPEEELVVNLPKSVPIEELDPLSADPHGLMFTKPEVTAKKEPESAGVASPIAVPKSADEQSLKFRPITLYVEFAVERFRDGLQFVGCDEDDPRYPHVYTRNTSCPSSASCLFPCVDTLTSRCTWDISITCHRTLGDVARHMEAAAAEGHSPHKSVHMNNGFEQNGANGNQRAGEDAYMSSTRFTVEDCAREMAVVCSGELADELVDPIDPTKKTVSFVCSTLVAPQHIAFAVGPFEYFDLSELRESDEDTKLGENAIRLHGYCLPGRSAEVANTCFPMAKAIDFFTMTFGSYPFSSYALCFVDDLSPDIAMAASISICSTRLLFPEDIIDPMDNVARQLVHALASQWMGINIVAKEPSDTWVVVGIAHFITDMFMRKLSGNNEYRLRQKKAADKVCELDIGRPSIFRLGTLLALDPTEMDFLALKAPLVLFILDRRLAKATGSSGLARIVSRIFLMAKVGDLPNGCITTAQFHRTCEKLGHTKLEAFFQQWVYGAGCPRFIVTQRFNKKKLVVEMLIRQVQDDLKSQDRALDTENFARDLKEELSGVQAQQPTLLFTGPMTIRIHEADGTPYEHIVEINEASTKFEIPYNTKYKRLKRSRRQKERAAAAAGLDVAAELQDDVLLYCLGDVLQSEEEVHAWRLRDWTKDDEDKMNQESYEWIRMDADFEWISNMFIGMPGYMYLSQLQQDRDVIAQYESIQYISAQAENPLLSTIFVRTLMDKRYFHGIRTAAAHALAKCATDELDWIGLFHLEKAFQESFCYPDSKMTRPNDFSDRTAYYIQCAIPKAMAKVRGPDGKAPLRVKRFIYDLLRFNDNSNNPFSDCYYLSTLMTALCDSLLPVSGLQPIHASYGQGEEDRDEIQFLHATMDEIERYQRIEEYIPSYQDILCATILENKKRLAKAKVIEPNIVEYLQYTRPSSYDPLRIGAFRNLVELSTLKNDLLVRYLLQVLSTDPSPYVRDALRRLFMVGLGNIAVGKEKAENAERDTDELIIEHELTTDARRTELARRQTVSGALAALKEEMGDRESLKQALWDAVTSPEIGLAEIHDLLDICSLLYESRISLSVKLRLPRYWRVEDMGNAKLNFTRTGNYRAKPMPDLNGPHSPTPPHVPQGDEDENGDHEMADSEHEVEEEPRPAHVQILKFKPMKPPKPEPDSTNPTSVLTAPPSSPPPPAPTTPAKKAKPRPKKPPTQPAEQDAKPKPKSKKATHPAPQQEETTPKPKKRKLTPSALSSPGEGGGGAAAAAAASSASATVQEPKPVKPRKKKDSEPKLPKRVLLKMGPKNTDGASPP